MKGIKTSHLRRYKSIPVTISKNELFFLYHIFLLIDWIGHLIGFLMTFSTSNIWPGKPHIDFVYIRVFRSKTDKYVFIYRCYESEDWLFFVIEQWWDWKSCDAIGCISWKKETRLDDWLWLGEFQCIRKARVRGIFGFFLMLI